MTETPATGQLEVVGRSWVGRDRLRRDLAEISASPEYESSAYLTSPTGAAETEGPVREAIDALPDLGTGAAIFYGSQRRGRHSAALPHRRGLHAAMAWKSGRCSICCHAT